MKQLAIVLFTVLLGCSDLKAQALHYGIKGGLSFTNYRDGSISGFDFQTTTNYHLGAFAELKVLGNLFLQPELLYSTKGAQFDVDGFDVRNQIGYISIPVLAKVFVNENSISMEVGPQFSFLASERNRIGTETASYEFGVVAGLGFRMTEMFYLQGRYILGVTDVKENTSIKNSAIQLSLGIFLN